MPVQIMFMEPLFETNGRITLVAPQSTNSSNLSRMSTSSMPYFDGEIKNRGPVETEADSVTVTVS